MLAVAVPHILQADARHRYPGAIDVAARADTAAAGIEVQAARDVEPEVGHLADGESVHAVRLRHPSEPVQIEVHHAFGAADLGDRHPAADPHTVENGSTRTPRVRARRRRLHMVWPQPERVRAVGQRRQFTADVPAHDIADLDPRAALHHRRRVDRRIGEHLRGRQIDRAAIHILRRPELRDRALVQRRRVAAEQQRLGGFRRGVHDRAVTIGEEPRQFIAQPLAQLVVEVGQRLVEQHQVGVLHQRARQRGALLLAARQLGRSPVEQR